MSPAELLDRVFTFEGTGQLLALDFVQSSLLAGALLALVAGALGPLVVARQVSFAVHGTSELTFTGAAAALLVSASAVSVGALVGAVTAALVFGLLGLRERERERDSVIGVVLAFGLGLGGLFLWLYEGRASNQFSLLFGQIVAVGRDDLWLLAAAVAAVLVVLAAAWRPLLFASVDADVARARGVPVRGLSVVFAVLVGVATGLAVPTVGALLVLALLITPAAAAAHLTANPVTAMLLATLIAEVAVVGGIVASLAPGAPISAYVTAIAFVMYLSCRVTGAVRARRGSSRRAVTT
ncbi:MAG: iron chelate uptake ABC transporter family permease subunit [Pseudonocardiaceae bacterium]|nr:iron chelate uptake ABC transporter family permease subunit [Pseudonocardiaceae bacterium]